MRPACILAAAALTWFASLQFNDPDPITWVTVYGLAAIACAVVGLGRSLPWRLFGFYALVCFGWAGSLAVHAASGGTSFTEAFDFSPGFAAMRSTGIEEGREAAGLLIVALWMGVVAVWRWRSAPVRHSVHARNAPFP
ncbi:MAG: transmembrane 220 family protein [Myxococcaceae bacterium]|nr:transmembrane 220 family protein [Myxococcaceae bacterium]